MRYLRPAQLFDELLKLNATGPLLGLSVGNRHVGLAISDPTKRIDAYPFRTLVKEGRNFDSVASDLQTLISKHSIAGFVIGFPYSSHDYITYSSPRGGPSELFLRDLIKHKDFEDMNFTVWDDARVTRKLKLQQMKESAPPKDVTRPVTRTRVMDYYAAFEILQDYQRFIKICGGKDLWKKLNSISATWILSTDETRKMEDIQRNCSNFY